MNHTNTTTTTTTNPVHVASPDPSMTVSLSPARPAPTPTPGVSEAFHTERFGSATKTCTTCDEVLPLASFAKKRGGFAPKCRTCTNEYSRRHYQQNKLARIAQVGARKTRTRAQARAVLQERRETQCCAVCGVAGTQQLLVSVSEVGQCADLVRRERLQDLVDHLEGVGIEWLCRPCQGKHLAEVRLGRR